MRSSGQRSYEVCSCSPRGRAQCTLHTKQRTPRVRGKKRALCTAHVAQHEREQSVTARAQCGEAVGGGGGGGGGGEHLRLAFWCHGWRLSRLPASVGGVRVDGTCWMQKV